MESMKEKLTEYAQLLVRVGLNIQRGQPLDLLACGVRLFRPSLCGGGLSGRLPGGGDELGRR